MFLVMFTIVVLTVCLLCAAGYIVYKEWDRICLSWKPYFKKEFKNAQIFLGYYFLGGKQSHCRTTKNCSEGCFQSESMIIEPQMNNIQVASDLIWLQGHTNSIKILKHTHVGKCTFCQVSEQKYVLHDCQRHRTYQSILLIWQSTYNFINRLYKNSLLCRISAPTPNQKLLSKVKLFWIRVEDGLHGCGLYHS